MGRGIHTIDIEGSRCTSQEDDPMISIDFGGHEDIIVSGELLNLSKIAAIALIIEPIVLTTNHHLLTISSKVNRRDIGVFNFSDVLREDQIMANSSINNNTAFIPRNIGQALMVVTHLHPFEGVPSADGGIEHEIPSRVYECLHPIARHPCCQFLPISGHGQRLYSTTLH